MSKPSIGAPSPKKLKTGPGPSQAISSPQKPGASPRKSGASPKKPGTSPKKPGASPRKPGASPKKFRPKKYYSPKKSPRKATPMKFDEEGPVGASSLEKVTDPAAIGRTSGEVYYTANFKDVLNRCLLPSNPERHVISEQDESLVKEFMELGSSCQQLYVRLFLRKHHWIRGCKLSYPDIVTDLSPPINSLCNKKFLVNESDLKDPSAVLGLLQVSELKSLCKQLHMPASVVGGSKAKMISGLFKQDREHQPLFGSSQFMVSVVKRGKASLGECVKVAEKPVEVFSKLMLLFSITNAWLNRDEDNDFSQVIYRMLQVNVGKLAYPGYEIVTTQPLFKDVDAFERYRLRISGWLTAREQLRDYYGAVKEEQKFQRSLEDSEYNLADRILGTAEVESKEWCETRDPSLPPYFLPFTRGHVLSRIISHGVEYREKLGKYQEACKLLTLLLSQSVYSQHRRGRWWDRLALNCDFHLKDQTKCLNAIKSGLADPLSSPAIRLSLTQRARRTLQSKAAKKRKLSYDPEGGATDMPRYTLEDFPQEDFADAPEITIDGKQLRSDSNKPFFLTRGSQRREEGGPSPSPMAAHRSLVGVEAYAIEHYMTKKGWSRAVHAENSTFSTLYALLMWDVIFSPVPDVFRAPMQNAPLDFFSECFYANRREEIDSRVCWVRAASREELSSAVGSSWERHCGQVCVGVDWNLFPDGCEDAKSIAISLGGEVLANICELFSKTYRSCCSGLPDLTLWDPNKNKCKFVEVKGPGDKLSCKQIVWLSRLIKWNCSAEVCRVRNKMT